MATTSAFPTPLVMRLLAASVSVSYKAGHIIRDILKTGELGIVEKGRNDLQTEADRAAQRCIVATLHKHFPKVAIFGEETLDPAVKIPDDYIVKDFDPEVLSHPCPTGYKDITDDQVVIWVDPLDGTAEFTQGLLDHVTVLIGVAVNGEAKGGVIYQPYYNYQEGPDATLGRCIWGLVGLGAFGFQPATPPVGKNLITTTRSHSDWMVTEAVNACEPTDIIRVGGAGHKAMADLLLKTLRLDHFEEGCSFAVRCCHKVGLALHQRVVLLLEGKAHAYVFASKGCKKWDTCAPEAVLHAIGGHLTDLLGNPILYYASVQRQNSGGVLATLQNHQWYVNKIPPEIRANFVSDTLSDGMLQKKQQLVEQIVCLNCGGDDGSSVDPPEFNQVDYSEASAQDYSDVSAPTEHSKK